MLAKKCSWAILALFLSTTVFPQGFLHADGKKIVDGKGENVLLRGIGLGGWMLQEGYMLKLNKEGQQHKIKARIESLVGPDKTARFYEAWLNNHCTRADMDSLKKWGFNSVRLPMHYELYTLPADKEPVPGVQTWLEKGFRLTDSLLSWCSANQMYLILDLHAAPGGQGNDLNISDRDESKPSLWESEANQQKTVALWKKLATRYRNEPWIGGYDILNEPNWGFEDPSHDRNGLKEKKNEPLKKLLVDITRAIREADNNHLIIIEGNGWGNNYSGMLPAWDPNMVLSFHKYWNFNDQASIQHILNTRDQYNVPVWLGETGENSNVWFTDAISLLESNNIGWAWWPLKKLGLNNPMQISSNTRYNKILAYWEGRGPKPSAEDAYQGLLDLALSSHAKNVIVKHDVIDAMIRQPHSKEALPFRKTLLGAGTSIRAVDYDLGRNGIAYWDKDSANYRVSTGKGEAGNKGNSYRNDAVDIYQEGENGDSYYVGHTEAGEWLQYTCSAAKAGTYRLLIKYRAKEKAGQLLVAVNGQEMGRISLPQSGSWNLAELKAIKIGQGSNQIRLKFLGDGIELLSMEFRDSR